MADAELVGYDSVMKRALFVLEIDTPEEFLVKLTLSSPRYACLLAWDARNVDAGRVARFARRLLDSGAVYVCVWGPDCERVHDIIDEEEVGSNPSSEIDSVVMTTWHATEPLGDAIWFVLHNSWPDEAYAAGCDSTLGLAIGSQVLAREIRWEFANPREE